MQSISAAYQLQLFADLHTLFGNACLQRVDSDGEKILSCEAYNIAKRTALQLGNVQTSLADDLLESRKEDENRNLVISFQLKNENHALRLNERLTTRGHTIAKLKQQLIKMKGEIIGCMVDNINDQNRESSLMALISVFNLSSDEDLVSRCEKLSELYDLYGIVNEH